MARQSWVDISRRLAHVDILLKNTVQESILNIELVKAPTTGEGKRKHQMDSGMLDNRTESFSIINTKLLFKPFGDQARFVSINCTVSPMFELEYPLAIDQVAARRRRNEVPGSVRHESLVFCIHSTAPIHISGGVDVRARLGSGQRGLTPSTGRTVGNGAVGDDLGPPCVVAEMSVVAVRRRWSR